MTRTTIEQTDVASQRVLMRVDFNVPIDRDGAITDDRRIRLALPSIQSVVTRGGRLILISHRGRPHGDGVEPSLSLRVTAERLRELLDGVSVIMAEGDCVSEKARCAAEALQDGEIIVLENLRFNAGEKKGDPDFASKLASMADIYCNNAFGTAHRDDASMVALPNVMKGKPRVAGLLLERELTVQSGILDAPARPFVAVLGGAKVSDKLAAVANLMDKVDTLLIGGAMAYTFLKALGHEMGSSMVQTPMIDKAQAIIDQAAASPCDLILPTDHVCGRQLTHPTPVQVCTDSIPTGWMGLDIGPETTANFTRLVHGARTVVWNGPVGAFETPPFDVGTKQIAEAVARAGDGGATTVAGGGDTAAALAAAQLTDRLSHVSTGGGASLQMLEGRRFASVDLLDSA